MKWTVFDFLKDQFTKREPVEKADLTGQVVLVTGANTGLGYEAAKHLALMNPARLVLGCRSKERGEDALRRLTEETGYTSVVLYLLDLASFASVSAFADKFELVNDRLDIAVHNAALWNAEYIRSQDGWESSLQVNNLSTPLLALRLLPLMKRTSKDYATTPRLVVVSSGVHYNAQVPALMEVLSAPRLLEKLSEESSFPISVLNLLFVRALASRVSSVTPVAVSPGLCVSDLRRNVVAGSWLRTSLDCLTSHRLGFTTEEGSRMLVFGALGMRGDEAGIQGQFVFSSKVAEPSDFVISPDGKRFEEKYWKELLEILVQVDAKIQACVQELDSLGL
ncbi:short-chain dehydrogenase [Cylindrobasidium torrendii FP15055 ss-10]|uniref:Short-chain dehydrogenase n=1 Tax=Cylindrobasidium torrendii FP15055 ss-10 TaxID=1314674 RepID=A0A0D7B5I3_9AGAR|nr:short-chain dehydrogenase [Cylindrobasidium torrendii FP15055 ss-10]